MRTLIVLALVGVMLAGCTDEAPVKDEQNIEIGKGAIAGLLVDDRFRPIQLIDTPVTEFQSKGFVLLQETGEQLQSNENGEFIFNDLEPGSYTLRVTVEGHEASPAKTAVAEGVFSEVSLVARRTVSNAGAILTQEYAVFIACPVDALVVTYANPEGCWADLSGDSGRFDFSSDLSAVEDLTALVTEAKFSKPGWNDVVIREFESGDCPTATLGDCMYAEATTQDDDYLKFINIPGEVNDEYDPPRNLAFRTDLEFQTAVFPHPDSYGTLRPVAAVADPPLAETGRSIRGVGPAMGIKAQFLQSMFIGEPEVDLAGYCVIC